MQIAQWPFFVLKLAVAFHVFSLLTLLVMNFDRYLATSYPIFHRTSVTKRRLLTLFATIIIVDATLAAMSLNDFVISFQLHALILFVLVTPPMLFLNYKLFRVVRESSRNNRIFPEKKRTFSLTKISSCLIAVVCYIVLSVPTFVYIGIRMNLGSKTLAINDSTIAGMWSETMLSINCAMNCL